MPLAVVILFACAACASGGPHIQLMDARERGVRPDFFTRVQTTIAKYFIGISITPTARITLTPLALEASCPITVLNRPQATPAPVSPK